MPHFLQIIPSLKGVSESVNKQLSSMPDLGKGSGSLLGKNLGKNIEDGVGDGAKKGANEVKTRLSAQLGAEVGSVLGRGIGGALHGSITVAAKAGELAIKGAMIGAAGVAAVALGGVGLALTKGFDRLKSIDQAKFKLQALGNDAASVAKIMDSALASVKGTAFGMDDAVTAAASAVAAGIKPGQDLTKYLKDVGDAASIAGTSFEDMGSIFNKIQTSNKAYTDDLQQLSDRGLPIFTWLQKEYGVTGDALSKMVQDGEVDAAHFQHAIETNIGGAALKMGDSFQGSVDNAEAALGRLGAALLKPLFDNAAGGIGSLSTGLDSLTNWVNGHQADVINFFTEMGITAVEVAQDIVKSFGEILKATGQFTTGLGKVLDFFGIDNDFASIGGQIDHIGDSLVKTSEGFDAARDRISNWGQAAKDALNGVGQAVGGIGTQVGALPFKKIVDISVAGNAKDAIGTIGDSVNRLPFKKTIEVEIHGTATGKAVPGLDGATFKGSIDNWIAGGDAPTFNPPNPIRTVPRRASGGPVFGAGTATSDSIPALLSNGEHVWTAAEVAAAGGQSAMYRMRAAVRGFSGGGRVPWPLMDPRGPDPRGGKDADPSLGPFAPWWDMDWMPPEHPGKIGPSIPGVDGKWWHRGPNRGGQSGWRAPPLGKYRKPLPGQQLPPWLLDPRRAQPFSTGGAVGPDVQAAMNLVGTPYSKGSRFDCSGSVARVINAALGIPDGGLMTTKTAAEWLAARGFKPGVGGPGAISVGWYDHGPNPNDGHMAMTLSDGTNAESGGKNSVFTLGAGASGASSAQFDHHMFLAIAKAVAPLAEAAGDSAAPAGEGPPTSGSGGGGSLPSSISGLASFGLSSLGAGVGTTQSGSDLSAFGGAAAAAVSGQVDSALGVLGVGGSPGILKAATMLVGGLKVGGHDPSGVSDGSIFNGANPLGGFGQGSSGASAVPLSATSTAGGTPPPDAVHGANAGQPPGPQTVFNIRTATVEDAFLAAQRKTNEAALLQTSRF